MARINNISEIRPMELRKVTQHDCCRLAEMQPTLDCEPDSSYRHQWLFFFEHDPRFQLYSALARTENGAKFISYVLNLNENCLNRDWFGHWFQEAVLYYTAHKLYLSLVYAQSQSLGTMRQAGNKAVDLDVFINTGSADMVEVLSPMSLGATPFGMHVLTLLNTSNVSFMMIDTEGELLAHHSGYQHSRLNRHGRNHYGYNPRLGCC